MHTSLEVIYTFVILFYIDLFIKCLCYTTETPQSFFELELSVGSNTVFLTLYHGLSVFLTHFTAIFILKSGIMHSWVASIQFMSPNSCLYLDSSPFLPISNGNCLFGCKWSSIKTSYFVIYFSMLDPISEYQLQFTSQLPIQIIDHN